MNFPPNQKRGFKIVSDSGKNSFEDKLRRAVETIDVARALIDPLTDSIDRLLVVSAASLKSEDASVLVRDGDQDEMVFLTAIGRVGKQLVGMRIPAGKGIAGFVLASGQPLAVADVGQHETFYAEVDRQTGFSTQTILATPLKYNDEIIGVLEYVNRTSEAPEEAFTPDEMDQAALFADAIASLVNAHLSARILGKLNEKLIAENTTDDFEQIRDWLSAVRTTADHREMIDLALLVREIAGRGERERNLCREILEAVARHSKSQTENNYLSY